MREKPQLQALCIKPTPPFTAAGTEVKTNERNKEQKAILFAKALSGKCPTEIQTFLIFQNRFFKP